MSKVLATSRPLTPPRFTTCFTVSTALSMGRIGMALAEPRQPLVVDADHLDGGLGVVDPRGGAQDPVEHLGLHAVAVLVLQAELRVAQTVDALLAVLVEPGGGHAVGTVDLARDILAAGRAHPAR